MELEPQLAGRRVQISRLNIATGKGRVDERGYGAHIWEQLVQQLQSLLTQFCLAVELRIGCITPKDVLRVTVTCQSSRPAKPGVQLKSTMSQPDRLGHTFAGR